MKPLRLLLVLLLSGLVCAVRGQSSADPHALSFMGLPLEGSADTLETGLSRLGFDAWGVSDGGESRHYRGSFYGIRGKLLVSVDTVSSRVQSAYVTVGPYSTSEMLTHNFLYLLGKLRQEHGDFTEMPTSLVSMGDYGLVKLSEEATKTGSFEIKVFYFPTAPFYKDALMHGLRGHVLEVLTDNPIMESSVLHFDREGMLDQRDVTGRQYTPYGYLTAARMQEPSGAESRLSYDYDAHWRLKRRALENEAEGIRSVTDYEYDSDGRLSKQSQKVFNRQGDCLLSITTTNSYTAFDDNDNWTENHLHLVYWERATGTQQADVVQKRSISYYD